MAACPRCMYPPWWSRLGPRAGGSTTYCVPRIAFSKPQPTSPFGVTRLPQTGPFTLNYLRVLWKRPKTPAEVRTVSPPTILIVEPDAHLGKVLQITLEETLPVETVVTNDLEQTKAVLGERAPDLVIVNVFTRAFNGFEAIALLKTTSAFKDATIFAFGARGNQIALARAMGCHDILPIPFRVSDVIARVLRYLDVQPKVLLSDIGHLITTMAGDHSARR